MIGETITTRARLTTRAASRASKQAWRGLLRSRLLRWRFRGQPIDQLLLVPQDLRTGDPSFASEIYHGHFGLADTVAVVDMGSPFTIPAPTPEWEHALHGFGWLRHLRAAHDEISREHSRTLVRDWIALHSIPTGIAWEPDVTARRIISWLSHAPIFVDGVDEKTYDQIMRSLAMQLGYLRSTFGNTDEGLPRLTALIALELAGLCADDKQPSQFARTRQLCDELKRQVLPDGGHISRNPVNVVELLLDLLPLRQCYVARDQIPPDELLGAIDRMMPMLRFFRLGSQDFARFNGLAQMPMENVAALMVHDDVEGQPISFAEQSGYCRLEGGETVIVADVGRPPPIRVSHQAHAGCLSFEMHSGLNPVIVNCGVPIRELPQWRVVARATAAHSTLVVSDASSGHLTGFSASGALEDDITLSGPVNVQASVLPQDDGTMLRASHDGYDQRFGITHVRRLTLNEAGNRLEGSDELVVPHGLKGAAKENGGAFAIRFHLHPSADVTIADSGHHIDIELPGNDVWRFRADAGEITVEESIYLPDVKGPQKSLQIVVYGVVGDVSEAAIAWRFMRLKAG